MSGLPSHLVDIQVCFFHCGPGNAQNMYKSLTYSSLHMRGMYVFKLSAVMVLGGKPSPI